MLKIQHLLKVCSNFQLAETSFIWNTWKTLLSFHFTFNYAHSVVKKMLFLHLQKSCLLQLYCLKIKKVLPIFRRQAVKNLSCSRTKLDWFVAVKLFNLFQIIILVIGFDNNDKNERKKLSNAEPLIKLRQMVIEICIYSCIKGFI